MLDDIPSASPPTIACHTDPDDAWKDEEELREHERRVEADVDEAIDQHLSTLRWPTGQTPKVRWAARRRVDAMATRLRRWHSLPPGLRVVVTARPGRTNAELLRWLLLTVYPFYLHESPSVSDDRRSF
jgi:hypothetical protein